MKTVRKRTVGLIGIIAEEDICVGFVLAGCAERNKKTNDTNVYVAETDTPASDIQKWLQHLINRRDILVVAISKAAAEKVRDFITKVEEAVPQIIEIPNKYDDNYEVETQSFQRRFGNFDANAIEQVTEEEVTLAAISQSSTAMVSVDVGPTVSSSLEYKRANAPYLSATALQTLEEARHNQSGIFAPAEVNAFAFSLPKKFSMASIQSFMGNRPRTLKFEDEMSTDTVDAMSLTQSTHSSASKRDDDKRRKEAEKRRREEERRREKEEKKNKKK